MSHIDSFKHEIVGLFGSIPVYHPLEEINGDFICTPEQLVLGGGSGEHPALLFENLSACVAQFLEDRILKNGKRQPWNPIIAPYLTIQTDKLLTFYDWNDDTFASFLKLCGSKGLPYPFEPHYHKMEFKKWLVLGIGEFVFYALPQMAEPLMSQLEAPYEQHLDPEYNNIMIIPPNVPVYANGGNLFFKTRKS